MDRGFDGSLQLFSLVEANYYLSLTENPHKTYDFINVLIVLPSTMSGQHLLMLWNDMNTNICIQVIVTV